MEPLVSPHASVKPAPSLEKMPNLDGLRAFACLFVVFSHIPKAGFAGIIGSVGVGVFFTLSGFLMGYLYARQSCDTNSVRQYAIARFSRIVPIYWLVISVCVLLSLFEGPEFPLLIDNLTSIVRHYSLAGNVGPFWSIPLEIQYYVFFVFMWYCLSLRRRAPILLVSAVLVCTVLVATNDYWPNLSLPNKLHFFLAGTIAGLMPRSYWKAPERASKLAILQLIAIMVILFPLTRDYNEESFYDSVGLSVAFGAAVYVLSFSGRVSGFLFATKPMRKVGQASFSIYLIHVLVLYYGARLLHLDHHHFEPLWVLVALAATLLPMVVSHFIEMPLQRTIRENLERISARWQPTQAPQAS